MHGALWRPVKKEKGQVIMASLASQVPLGTSAEFLNRLGRFGVTEEDVRRVNGDDGLALKWAGDLKRRLAPSVVDAVDTANLVRRLFTGLTDQVSRVRQWNDEFGWGFTRDDLGKAEGWIGPHISDWPADRLIAITLVPYLPDQGEIRGMERTFHMLWRVAARQQKGSCRWDGYNDAGRERIQLLKGIEHQPGLRWEVIDLGVNRGKAPKDVRDPRTSPHAGILASAALHPEWVRQMDEIDIPYVWAPGYEVNVPGGGSWQGVPCVRFHRDDQRVGLGCDWRDFGDNGYAMPEFRGE